MMDETCVLIVILAIAGIAGLVAWIVIELFQRDAGRIREERACETPNAISVRVMSHNIRYAATERATGEEPWPIRLPFLASQFVYHSKLSPDCFICLQEVLHHQLVDLLVNLNGSNLFNALIKVNPGQVPKGTALEQGEWAAIGVGRDDGKEAGEYSPILYRPKVWSLKRWKTIWLSPEPMRRGWDAASVRILTVASFQHQGSGKDIVVMNTHLDDQGPVARRKGAEIVVDVMKQWTRQDGARAVLMTGDLNSEVDGDAYQMLSRSLSDASEQCRGTKRYGEYYTFTGFSDKEAKQRLDYIFTSAKSAKVEALELAQSDVEVQGFAILPNRFEREAAQPVYMSDHRAIVADVAIRL